MKIIMLGGAFAMLAGGFYAYKDRIFVPANVYAAPIATVYQALDAMDLPHGPQAPMGTLEITKHAVEPQSITWSGAGAHAMIDCTASLVALDAQRTRVDTACGGGGPSEGAAAGMAAKLLQIAMVEQIDSTLRGRPFDKQKVQMAAGVSVLQNLPKMQSDALQMQRDMQQQIDAGNAEMAQRAQSSSVSGSGYAPPGQPLDPQGTDPVPASPVN